MLTAHLPSGYLLTTVLSKQTPWIFWSAVVGSVLPDIDLIWFYFMDNGAHHHHRYWVHIPLFWIVSGVALILANHLMARTFTSYIGAFFAGIFLHLILDSISGGIMWGAPFSDKLFALIHVPATQSHWALSFFFHWTFVTEVIIWITAICVYIRKARP